MNFEYSLSSECLSRVLKARNPLGSEEDWFLTDRKLAPNWRNIQFYTSIANFVALGIVNIIESMVYAVFAALSLFVVPFTNAPLRFFAKLLSSSSFTGLWLVVSLALHIIVPHLPETREFLISHPCIVNIVTKEYFFRSIVSEVTGWNCFRKTDERYTVQWIQNHERNIGLRCQDFIPAIHRFFDQNNKRQRDLLCSFFDPRDEESRRILVEEPHSMRAFFTMKPFIYYGLDPEGVKQPIPSCLSKSSIEKIEQLRRAYDQGLAQEILAVTQSLSVYHEKMTRDVPQSMREFLQRLDPTNTLSFKDKALIIYYGLNPMGSFCKDDPGAFMRFPESLSLSKKREALEAPGLSDENRSRIEREITDLKIVMGKIDELRNLPAMPWHEEMVALFANEKVYHERMEGISPAAKEALKDLEHFACSSEETEETEETGLVPWLFSSTFLR